MVWYLKQLFPHTNWTTYGDQRGVTHFCIWKQWMGRCYAVIDITLSADA